MSRPTRVVVIDCETTGLDPDRHRIVEVAWRVFEPGHNNRLNYFDTGHLWVGVNDWGLADADAETLTALEINQAVRRYDPDNATSGHRLAERLREVLDGALVVGLNPLFDVSMIAAHCARYELPAPYWYYWTVDVKALAQSETAVGSDPLSSEWLMRRHGVNPDRPDRHTAAGDVGMTVDLADAALKRRGGSWTEWVEAAIDPTLIEGGVAMTPAATDELDGNE